MRELFSHRAIGKDSGGLGSKAVVVVAADTNMAATNTNTTNTNTTTTTEGAGGGGGGGGGGGSGHILSPSSPVPEWSGEPVMLKEFASKRRVPGFARVVKGSYATIGPPPKFALSLQRQHHELYVHAVKVGVKVLGHCVRRAEVPGPRRGQTLPRLHPTDQRLTVPLTYQGWFELLSEDGKSARPIAGVPELARVFPARVVVRENVKAYVSSPPREGRATFDKTRVIPAGEQLQLCGELSLPSPGEGVQVKLLRCLDAKGDGVFLSFDQKGLFTPISGENDFTGVFTIRDIVRRFRLPLTVKLVQGVRPRVPDSKFSGIVRLDWVYTEETAFVCPLEKNHVRLLPVPCDVPLQLVAAGNQEELCSTEMFRSMQAKCGRMVSNYNNTLHLIVNVPESVVRTHARHARASNLFSAPLQPAADLRASTMRRSKSREDVLMAEIDDLYGYVRDGGAVPPKVRFQYDSDEESYWEEPAYEPLDEFRARLKAMEAGQRVSFPAFYRPADPTHLKGLVGGSGSPGPPPAGMGLPLSGPDPANNNNNDDNDASDSVYGVIAGGGGGGGSRDESSSSPITTTTTTAATTAAAAAKGKDPPPLPPRPPEMMTTSSSSTTVSTETFTITVTSAAGAGAGAKNGSFPHSPIRLVQSRRVSMPPTTVDSVDSPANCTLLEVTSRPFEKQQEEKEDEVEVVDQEARRRQRVSRSDSEPSIPSSPLPTSSADARPKPVKQQSQEEAARPDWKERLRRFNAMEDKGKGDSGGGDREGSSSASSDSVSGQKKLLARDFKDSDISSRTRASSGSDGRGVRRRMQTLYL